MAFQGQAVRTQGVASTYTSVGKKLSETSATNWTLNVIAAIKYSKNSRGMMPDVLQVWTRNIVQEKAYDLFHD